MPEAESQQSEGPPIELKGDVVQLRALLENTIIPPPPSTIIIKILDSSARKPDSLDALDWVFDKICAIASDNEVHLDFRLDDLVPALSCLTDRYVFANVTFLCITLLRPRSRDYLYAGPEIADFERARKEITQCLEFPKVDRIWIDTVQVPALEPRKEYDLHLGYVFWLLTPAAGASIFPELQSVKDPWGRFWVKDTRGPRFVLAKAN